MVWVEVYVVGFLIGLGGEVDWLSCVMLDLVDVKFWCGLMIFNLLLVLIDCMFGKVVDCCV